jgi:hypothetical protein
MKAKLTGGWGYQGDNMNLPVADVNLAAPFYERVMAFRIESRGDDPYPSIVLERDGVRIALAENGQDPTQDGCAFHVDDVAALFEEFKANGLEKEVSDFSTEDHDGQTFKVFYVVAPDGLCYWFGQKI